MHNLGNLRPPEFSSLQQHATATPKVRDLASSLDPAKLGSWICEPAANRFWATDWFWRITELQPKRVGGSLSAFIKCLHTDDRSALAAAIEHANSAGDELDLEVRLIRSDNTIRWLNLRGRALTIENGHIRITGVVTDSTALQNQQQELSRLQADLESLVENSPDIVVRFDATGKVLLASSAFLNRIKSESGLNFSLLQHLRDVATRTFASNVRQQQESCVEGAGRFQWVETRAIPEVRGDGSIASVITFTRDISDRKMNEDLLEGSRRSLLVAMESMELAHDAANLGYWEWDLATNKGFWSDRVYGMLGLTPGSVTPGYETWANCVHPHDRKSCDDALDLIYGPLGKYHSQYRVVLPDGSTRWMEDNGKLIRDFGGNPARIIGTITDITEQKEQQAALVYFEKLSSAMRLSSTLAHELNNPLTAVTYLLHLAQQDTSLSLATRGHLTAAQEELARASHVASQTLSLYRTPAEKSAVNVGPIVQDLLQIYRHRLLSRNVEVGVDLQDSAMACLPPGELRRILSNLLVNAMDAAASGGRRVHIRVRTISLPGSKVPPSVQIAVADQGPGIERSLQQKIFEPFFTTNPNHGIGLGLWLTRELVTRNSGRIAMRTCTTPGHSWTVFVVRFPEAATQDAVRKEAAGQAA